MDTNALIRFQQELTIFVETWNNNNHTQFKFNTADLLSYFLQSRHNLTISTSSSPLTAVQYPNNNLTEHGISRIICSPQNNVTQQQLQPTSPVSPITPSQNRNVTFDIHLATITEEKESKFLNARATEFVPTPTPSTSPPSSPMVSPNASQKQSQIRRKCKQLFRPHYPARAQLNIFIAKELTAQLLYSVKEDFPSAETLYYYIDISTALQINDGQMHIFRINNAEIVFVNYDLHARGSGDMLYGVIGLNKGHRIRQNKWVWKLHTFMTANEIYNHYCVGHTELPLSSRRMNRFQKQLEIECGLSQAISASVIGHTDWGNIQQIKSLKRNGSGHRGYYKRSKVEIVLKISKPVWMEECMKSWFAYPAIPIVVNENKNGNNSHWIEWIKLVRINENQPTLIGVSCQYVSHKEQWVITAINLDKGDILNKHRLIGYDCQCQFEKCIPYLSSFNTQFTEIQWIKSH